MLFFRRNFSTQTQDLFRQESQMAAVPTKTTLAWLNRYAPGAMLPGENEFEVVALILTGQRIYNQLPRDHPFVGWERKRKDGELMNADVARVVWEAFCESATA